MPHLSPHASCRPPPPARACSQTIFTMRAGVYSRWNGVVVAASELVMFALPFAVIQYLPTFFYGALLLWFGIEIR